MSLARLIRRVPIDGYLLALLATVALAMAVPARGSAAEGLDILVHLAVGGLFLLYGARLSPSSIWAGLSHWRLQGVVLLITFGLFPVLGVLMGWIVGGILPAAMVTGLVFVCLLPSTVQSSIAFTSIARGNLPAALCAASLSNLLGVVITPALVALVIGAHGAGSSGQALIDIGLQILAPFLVGQCLRPFVGEWLRAHGRLTMLADRGSILLIVYSAFGKGMVAGVWGLVMPSSLAILLALDALLLALVMGITAVTAKMLGFDREDRITILFCGSKKSMASGIPMANILFPGPGVGLIVLPLMLFHQVQLFACAILARRFSRLSEQAGLEAASSNHPSASDRETALRPVVLPPLSPR
ncbi:bile acid:sodium symporter family protein [Rhizorhabdus sp.]|uniref:bile acid:sodium symporter family protein n=1 Tax=Rhizorhabdus sp. TaxID=1968843 RepID=UPI0019C017B6|nr:bile acid:sodium symporter family protein [Rhizorhabdus sp.]MBD3760395.1 bile acid:sodium symporter [Rhizorhabdus sp.]